MGKIGKQLKAYWLPILWAFGIITTASASFNVGGAVYIAGAIVNTGLGVWSIIKFVKEWEKESDKEFYEKN